MCIRNHHMHQAVRGHRIFPRERFVDPRRASVGLESEIFGAVHKAKMRAIKGRAGGDFAMGLGVDRRRLWIGRFEPEAAGHFDRSKQDLQTEIAATLAFSAMGNNDKIGLILFAGEVEKVIPPKKGKKHVMRIIRTILEWEPQSQGTNVEAAVEHLLKIQKRHSNVFLMSDFLGSVPDRNFRIAAKRYDLCAINTFDRKEIVLPNVGLLPVSDAETGELQWIHTGSKSFKKRLLERYEEGQSELALVAKRSGAGYIQLEKDQDFVPPLLNYLKTKGK